MSEHEARTMQEYEFIMEGITTRMTTAIEEMGECNRKALESMEEANKQALDSMKAANGHMRNSIVTVCITMILVMLLVVFGFIRVLEMKGGDKTGEVVSANASAEISEHGQGADDR